MNKFNALCDLRASVSPISKILYDKLNPGPFVITHQ